MLQIRQSIHHLLLISAFASYLGQPLCGKALGAPGNLIWAAQIDFAKPHDQPWTAVDFQQLARDGINRVEINLNWADIEPQKGLYQFQRLDGYLDAAAQVHLKLILIFWESVWGEQNGKNPPSWLTTRDVTSDGIGAQQPPWWDGDSKHSYFDYVVHVIDHSKSNAGFGGMFADYGWLDAMWGPPPKGSRGVTGYADSNQRVFRSWLEQDNGSLASFNRRWRTNFTDWSQVPAERPGQPLFALYQEFRDYSVESTYNELSKLVRSHTDAPLFYYWGGGLAGHGGPPVLGNDPDIFFRAAKRWNATVVLDDADHGGLALLFGSMARAYKVPLLQEWTPRPSGLLGETPEWLGHIGLSAPFGTGEDFFIYPPPENKPGFPRAFQSYLEWRHVLSRIQGTVPEQHVAILIPTRKIVLSENLDAFKDLSEQLKEFWRSHLVLPSFVTDQQVKNGVVDLNRFRAVVDLEGASAPLPQLQKYASQHPVVHRLEDALPYLKPYATLDPANHDIEVTPTVDGSSIWVALANTNELKSYQGSLMIDTAAMHLPPGKYRAVDARTGTNLPLGGSAGKESLTLSLPAAALEVIEVTLGKLPSPHKEQTNEAK